MAKSELTQARVRELLDYDSATGEFRWKKRTSNRVRVGDIAGRDHGNGYVRISVDGEHHFAHRLAWFWTYGVWPANGLDHRDRNRKNNRLRNLREAAQVENQQNLGLRSTNTSGKTGVSWHKQRQQWVATIWSKRKCYHLGLFATVEAAADAYAAAKRQLHRFHPTVSNA